MSSNFFFRQRLWRLRIEEALAAYSTVGKRYQLIAEERLVGMYIIVYILSDLNHAVKNVSTATVGCGLMGTLGNKGAVAVRFNYFESTFCCISSHLAAHQEAIEKRNQDYIAIRSRLKFSDLDYELPDHSHIIWIGDLNYRIDLSNDVVRQNVQAKNLKLLLESDQLKNQMVHNN